MNATLTNLHKANTLAENKQYQEAEALYTQTLTDVRNQAEKDPATEIAILNQLGQLNLEQNNYKKAENVHLEALELCKTVLDEEVSETILMTVSLLCSVYEAQNQFEKALVLYREAIETAEKLLGEDDPDIAIAKCSQAAVFLEQGDYTKAQELYEESLPIIQEFFPEEKEAIEEIKTNLALVRKKVLQDA